MDTNNKTDPVEALRCEALFGSEEYARPTLYFEQLTGMEQRATHFLTKHTTRAEKRMARDVLVLCAWVRAEAAAITKPNMKISNAKSKT